MTAASLPRIRRRVGLLFQDPDDQLFCPNVFDDVSFGPRQLGLTGAALATRVADALRQVGLAYHHMSLFDASTVFLEKALRSKDVKSHPGVLAEILTMVGWNHIKSHDFIDSISRTGFAAAQKYFEELLGQGITANIFDGLRHSDTIFVLGGDPAAVNPVLGLAIRDAARQGARIVVLSNAKGLERFSTLQVTPDIFREAELLEALLAAIAHVKGLRGEIPAVDKGISMLQMRSSAAVNIPGFDEMKKALAESESVSVVFGPELVQRTNGHRALFAVAGLTYLLEARLYLLSEKPNEQGLIDAGCVPDMLPGGRPLSVQDFRRKFEAARSARRKSSREVSSRWARARSTPWRLCRTARSS